jgi:hypothetical protein
MPWVRRSSVITFVVALAVSATVASCGSATGGTSSSGTTGDKSSTGSSQTSGEAWQATVPPADPNKVIIAENLMQAEDPTGWGGKDGDEVFLAQTSASASPVDLTAARWEAFIHAFTAKLPDGVALVGVGTVPDSAGLTEGRPSFRFFDDPTFSPISQSDLNSTIASAAAKLGVGIQSISTSSSDAGPVAIVTATAPNGDVVKFAQDHPGISVELAGGPTGNVFVQVLAGNGDVGYVDASVPRADAEFHWFDPGLPGCHYINCP